MKQQGNKDRLATENGASSLATGSRPTSTDSQSRSRPEGAAVTESARANLSSHQLPSRYPLFSGISDADPCSLVDRYQRVRSMSEWLCDGLEVEDYVVQSMPDVSPLRWHLAHTTWFFETFLLKPLAGVTSAHHETFQYLFNSYYNQIGEQFPRAKRGLMTRPTVREVFQYRREVDEAMQAWLEQEGELLPVAQRHVLEVGLNHEQQHQELMLSDLKHVFSCNPMHPVYRTGTESRDVTKSGEITWTEFAGGVREIGHAGDGFAFDNESPRHEYLLMPFRLASRLVTVGEYLEFMADGGYQRSELWLSLGWQMVQQEGWTAPMYWEQREGAWYQFTLNGQTPLNHAEPVCHVSYFEADAFARWRGVRLPTEFEWEVAAQAVIDELSVLNQRTTPHSQTAYQYAFELDDGNFVEQQHWHPVAASWLKRHRDLRQAGLPEQMFGDVWEWTASPYVGYPRYRPPEGAIGEYNGKFMCNQFVLRGGSCATSATHLRSTYRNFFPPETRWQFSGIRLASDAT